MNIKCSGDCYRKGMIYRAQSVFRIRCDDHCKLFFCDARAFDSHLHSVTPYQVSHPSLLQLQSSAV